MPKKKSPPEGTRAPQSGPGLAAGGGDQTDAQAAAPDREEAYSFLEELEEAFSFLEDLPEAEEPEE